MDNQEQAYNQAVEMLKQGRSKDQIVLDFADGQKDFAGLLDISATLLSLPKNPVPTPLMRRRYAEAPTKFFWRNWNHISRVATVGASAMVLLIALTATGYAANNSAPGQSLFSLKKLAEKGELALTWNQNSKAKLQVAIAQQRLDQAQQIFSNPDSSPSQKTAVLTELTAQTTNAVAEVNTVAKTDPSSDQNHPLLKSLDTLTSQQKNLLATIKPDSQIQTAAQNALVTLNQSTVELSAIKQSVAVADSGQTLANLTSDPNAVAVFGKISQASSSQITVEKTTFTLTPQTLIQDSMGNVIALTDLSVNAQVNVVGAKTQNALVAKEILVTTDTGSVAQTPQVKGAATSSIPSDATVSTTTITTTATTTTVAGTQDKQAATDDKKILTSGTTTEQTVKPSATDTQTTTVDPNTASGLFIWEDPSPKFSP